MESGRQHQSKKIFAGYVDGRGPTGANDDALGMVSMMEGDYQQPSNVDALFGPESSENMPVKEERVIRKAKRTLLRINSGSRPTADEPSTSAGAAAAMSNGGMPNGGSPTGHHGVVKSPLAFTKNSRKSRQTNYRSRGLPKKGAVN